MELGKYQDGGWGMGRGALLQRGEANTILPTLTKFAPEALLALRNRSDEYNMAAFIFGQLPCLGQ